MPENKWGDCKDCKWGRIEPGGVRREPDDGPMHRSETTAVPFASLGEQRVQPFHARRTGQGRGFRQSTPPCTADEVTIKLSAPQETSFRATRVDPGGNARWEVCYDSGTR